MGKMKIGIQVFSVRDDASKDFEGTMKQLKEMGYDGVELAGMYGLTAEKIREILDKYGLECISAHVGYGELMNDLDKTVAAYKCAGCSYIAFPSMSEENRPTAPGYDKVVENIKKISEKCKENGITLLYHNHDFEFAKMPNGQYALDYMYSVAGDFLWPEFDTCWVKVSGEDPVEYIKKYAGKVPVVHLKDFKGSKTANMYTLIGTDIKADVTEEFKFRPVGYGVQDFPAILKAAEESGSEWCIVEQDNSYDTPALEAAKMSVTYLRSIY